MNRPKVLIQRLATWDWGTPGKCSVVGTEYSADSLELPDRGNANDISCIPAGFYVGAWIDHPEHGWCYQILNVKNRQAILIHPFNLAGSVECGYAKQALGCIGLGYGVDIFRAGTQLHVEGPAGLVISPLTRDQRGIINSVKAVTDFNALLNKQPFDLEIRAPSTEPAPPGE